MAKKNKNALPVETPGVLRWPPLACGAVALAWTGALVFYRRDTVAGVFDALHTVPFVLQNLGAPDVTGDLSAIGTALAFIAGAVIVGRALLSLLARSPRTLAEDALLGLGAGLGFFSMLGFTLGMSGHYSPLSLRVGFAASVVIAGALGATRGFSPRAAATVDRRPASPFVLAAASTMLFGLLALNLAGALGPEIHYDALVYHLALPKLYLLHGRMVPTLNNIYSGIPLNTEMLYGFALALGGTAAAKLLPLLLSVATLGLIFTWVRRHASKDAALLAMLLFYSSPMVASQTWFSLVEMNWCFLSLLAFYCVVTAERDHLVSYRWLALVGSFAGLALGTKYNAVTSIAALFLSLAVRLLSVPELPKSEAAKRWAACAGVALLLVSPWLIKNFVFYGNPVFPFFDEWFVQPARGIDWRGLAHDAKARDLRSAAGFVDMLVSLWSREWGGADGLGLGAILLLPWLAFWRWKGSAERATALALCLGWAAWALSTRLPRFCIFVLPLLAIVLATGLRSVETPKPLRRLGLGILLLACLIDSGDIAANWMVLANWPVVLGRQPAADYLSHGHPMYPTPYYPAMDFINAKTPPGARVLFVGESRSFYCDRDHIADSAFVPNTLAGLIRGAKTGAELYQSVGRLGVDYLVVNRGEILRQRLAFVTHADAPVFDAFARDHLRQVFEHKVDDPRDLQWVQVFEVHP